MEKHPLDLIGLYVKYKGMSLKIVSYEFKKTPLGLETTFFNLVSETGEEYKLTSSYIYLHIKTEWKTKHTAPPAS